MANTVRFSTYRFDLVPYGNNGVDFSSRTGTQPPQLRVAAGTP